MTDHDMRKMTFDRARVNRLHTSYERALDAGKDSFEFDGYTLVTNYAKYLLEFLETQFDGRRQA